MQKKLLSIFIFIFVVVFIPFIIYGVVDTYNFNESLEIINRNISGSYKDFFTNDEFLTSQNFDRKTVVNLTINSPNTELVYAALKEKQSNLFGAASSDYLDMDRDEWLNRYSNGFSDVNPILNKFKHEILNTNIFSKNITVKDTLFVYMRTNNKTIYDNYYMNMTYGSYSKKTYLSYVTSIVITMIYFVIAGTILIIKSNQK